MSYPDVFKGIEGRLDDPIIEKLSVPGLYCCLMSDCFDQEFKKKLIVELRARSVKVLANVVPDELFFSPFPMYYLAHKYKVDKDNFVEGFKKPDVRKSTKFGL
uniref:Uncharacterized protein n=1 Tax=Panagrellus redivivus TaxID=6233 RepID=A0A7E4UMI4_PANRE